VVDGSSCVWSQPSALRAGEKGSVLLPSTSNTYKSSGAPQLRSPRTRCIPELEVMDCATLEVPASCQDKILYRSR